MGCQAAPADLWNFLILRVRLSADVVGGWSVGTPRPGVYTHNRITAYMVGGVGVEPGPVLSALRGPLLPGGGQGPACRNDQNSKRLSEVALYFVILYLGS